VGEGLEDEVDGAVDLGVLHDLTLGVPSEERDPRGGVERPDLLERVDAIHVRHLQIHEHRIGAGGSVLIHSIHAFGGFDDLMALFKKRLTYSHSH